MLRVFYWNVNKKDLRDLVCNAAATASTDVIILLESSVGENESLASLRASVSPGFHCPAATPGRFQLFSRNSELDLEEVYGGDRISLRRLSWAGAELLLGVVHVVDKLSWDDNHQLVEVELLASEIRRQEDRLGHDRTILIGDFNMNPFEPGMNMAPGMNAMMSVKCVERRFRSQQKREYRFFYNPMWGLFGDRTPGPSGTYYHSVGTRGNYGWNILDQVLIRPSAMPWFDDVQILSSAGAATLANAFERPNRTDASDHFPLLLSLRSA